MIPKIAVCIFYLLQNSFEQDISTICTESVSCRSSKYRTYDGTCNNLGNPKWGASFTRYNRLLPAIYADGISLPAVAKDGSSLPHARLVSFSSNPDVPLEDETFTLITMQFGQFLAHDMSSAINITKLDIQIASCCDENHKIDRTINDPNYCYPMAIPEYDPVYGKLGFECLKFSRSGTDATYGCARENRAVEQITGQTAFLDLSIVYGFNSETAKLLRLFQSGLLKFESRHGQKWLPRSQNSRAECSLGEQTEACYMAGDDRANQSPQLTLLQTLFFREHNRLADSLRALNRHWNDEKLFQEARKLNIAQYQKIVYYDLLPIYLGRKNMFKQRLIFNTTGYTHDYDFSVNPSVLNEHATAAFRYFHTNIAGQINSLNENRINVKKIRLGDNIGRPWILEDRNTSFDELGRGLVTQHMWAADEFHTEEITLNFGRSLDSLIGFDLRAICIQRSRDHGLATYNDLREYCGLSRATTFNDFRDYIPEKNINILSFLYKSPDDVDLIVGGSLEIIVKGTRLGPTFLCIIKEQFLRTRIGDRLFFENSAYSGFKPSQLKEIRKSSMSRLLCDNTNIKKIQPNSFWEISLKNHLVTCQELPHVKLSLWKEQGKK